MVKYFLDDSDINIQSFLLEKLISYKYIPNTHVLILTFESYEVALISNGAHTFCGTGDFKDSSLNVSNQNNLYLSYINKIEENIYAEQIEIHSITIDLRFTETNFQLEPYNKIIKIKFYGEYENFKISCVPIFNIKYSDSDLWRELNYEV